ncbi:MAG: sigma-70 family RNA polymerase sigma factor [Candidatus Hydrogenedentes bacterium]|nr:sigma-70 family RNA polymerase sigma factor [Candidatus Hydrogenedentota bacterium]
MSVALENVLRYEEVSGPEEADIGAGPRPAEGDAGLVSRAKSGDFRAFEELVRRYRNDVYALAYHFVRNREEAWDVSQEVFIKAHRSLGRFRGDSSFKTWVLRITANQCKDFLKKRRLDTVSYNDALEAEHAASPILGPEHAVEAKELGEAITTALSQLPFKHRTAFVLREFEGMTYEEMARVMGCNLGTVMSRLHHARKKLQHSLQRMGFAGG